jgi:plastocyanin
MKYFLYLILIFTTFYTFSQAENFPCKTDEMHKELFQKYPQYNQGIINANNRLQADTKRFLENGTQKSDAAYVIPVVFHIIHNYGPENISDAQVHDALHQVNLQFRKQNPDTNEILSQFKSIAADIEIEFRLAQLDPNGNCTSGITRTVSPLTSPGNHDVKSLIHWPPNKYLNVYICSGAAGLAGHSMLPSAADTIPQWDGIVMQHSYVGTIGTSEYFRRTVLSHEIGHFLNLQHIWGGNNVPDYYYLPVAQAGNCAYDDEVADTPNTIGWQSCNLNGTTCDGNLDNVQNYMDYAYCGRMFTEGQKARMHACLNSSVANRNNLWQESNLIATGTDNGTYYLCAAKFESDKQVVCVGDSIQFTDFSYHGVETREWEFPGGVANSTSNSTVKVAYSNPGTYDVKLKVTRGGEEKEILVQNYITILPENGLPHFYKETFENVSNIECVVLDNQTPYKWEANTNVGFNSQNSFYINNFDAPEGLVSSFYLNPVDASGLSSAVIAFDYAYAQKITSNNDQLQIHISKDCGQTWLLRRTLNGSSNLKTVTTPIATPFIPSADSLWANHQATTIPANHLVDDLLVRFSFKSAGGNNIYIDNIQVSDPNQLSITNVTKEGISIYPNPAKEHIFIHTAQEMIQTIEVYNLDGKIVAESRNINDISHQLNTSVLKKGTYIISITTEKSNYKSIHIIAD